MFRAPQAPDGGPFRWHQSKQPRLSRRTFFAGAGAGAVALGAAACTSSPSGSQGHHVRDGAILGLSFRVADRYRPFAVVDPQFVALSATASNATDLVVSSHSPVAPFAAVELEVRASDAAIVLFGLATKGGDHLLATYDRAAQKVGVELRVGGRIELLRQVRAVLPEMMRLGFVLCENQVTVVANSGHGWQPLLTERTRVAAALDLRVPETLANYRYAWGARPQRGPARLGNVRAGLFGMTGLRDPNLVQHSDGRPYQRDGKVYLTATCAGMGFFRQAHWGVFSLDLADPTRLEPVAKVFAARDGLVLGDHAGQLVRDETDQHWIVLNSSWGDFDYAGVHVRHATSAADLLTGVHLVATERASLPTTLSTWDPALTRIDGAWHLAFVESPSQKPFVFFPALAVASAGADWTSGLRLVGAASALQRCEGTILTEVDGHWWLLASDGQHREFPVFDLRLERVGRLHAPYPTNIPHPQLVQLPDQSYLMVTFNGTPYGTEVLGYGGHGDVVLMRSS